MMAQYVLSEQEQTEFKEYFLKQGILSTLLDSSQGSERAELENYFLKEGIVSKILDLCHTRKNAQFTHNFITAGMFENNGSGSHRASFFKGVNNTNYFIFYQRNYRGKEAARLVYEANGAHTSYIFSNYKTNEEFKNFLRNQNQNISTIKKIDIGMLLDSL